MKHILVVEDDESIASLLQQILEMEGFKVSLAGHGAQALEDLKTFKPDLILLDLFMPVMNGAEFLKEKRKNPALSTIPTILMSADDRISLMDESQKPDEILKKPVTIEGVLEKINRLLTNKAPI